MKRCLSLTLLIFLVVVASSSCGRARRAPAPPPLPESLLGEYGLTGYNDSGRPVFRGMIRLISFEQNLFKASCWVTKEPDGPQGMTSQSGYCEGLIDGSAVTIDTLVGVDSYGLLLEGEFEDGRITGVWKLGSSTGEPFGKFELVLRK